MTISHTRAVRVQRHRVLSSLGMFAIVAVIALGVGADTASAISVTICPSSICVPPPPPPPELDLAPEKTAEITADVAIGVASTGVGAAVTAVTALTPAAPIAPYLGPGVGVVTNVVLDHAGVDDAIETFVEEEVIEPVEEIVEGIASVPDKIDYSCRVTGQILNSRTCP